MEEEKVGFFSQLIGSITNFQMYRYFFKRTMGKAILYLLLLSLIFGTATILRSMYDFNTGISQVMRYFQLEIPDFTLENGELNVQEENMPIYFGDTDEGILIIDTTGKTNESVLDAYPNGMLVTKYEFIQKHNNSIERQKFSVLRDFRVTKDSISGFLPLLRVINVFIVIFGLLFHFVGKLISAILVAAAGLVICEIVKYRLPYDVQYKLSIYALTLPIILKAVVKILRVDIPFFWVLYYGIAVFYLWKAITTIKENREIEGPIKYIQN